MKPANFLIFLSVYSAGKPLNLRAKETDHKTYFTGEFIHSSVLNVTLLKKTEKKAGIKSHVNHTVKMPESKVIKIISNKTGQMIAAADS